MTVNQMMVLLDVYRGTYSQDRHLGTILADLRTLEHLGLIEVEWLHDGHQYRVTGTGNALVWKVMNTHKFSEVLSAKDAELVLDIKRLAATGELKSALGLLNDLLAVIETV